MFTLSFAKAATERALRATAWALSSLLIADGTGILDTAWADRLSVAGMAGVLSVLASIAGSQVGQTGPSLANEAIVPPARDPQHDGGYSLVELLVAVLVLVVIVYLLTVLF